jgi:hypothetical protein
MIPSPSGFGTILSPNAGKRVLALPLVLLLAGAGCASTVRVARTRPAEVNLAAYRKVAVGHVGGPEGHSIANRLTQALVESNRFEVLDRKHLEHILRERRLSASAGSPSDEAARIGKLAGTDAMIFGHVNRREYRQTRGRREETCSRDNVRYACTNYIVNGQWNTEVAMNVVDSNSGRILTAKTFRTRRTRSASSYSRWPKLPWGADSIAFELDQEIVDNFMRTITPYTVWERARFYTDGDLPELELGVRYSRQGDWENAIRQFRGACARAESGGEIHPRTKARAYYDLGVALGYSGRYEEGIREIEKANRIAPEDPFYAEIRKIERFRQDAERMRMQEEGSLGVSRNSLDATAARAGESD